MARLLRAATGIKGLDPHAARAQVYAQVRDADPEDLALFDDLMGIADPDVKLPKIDPDARRRRLTAHVNAVSVAREGLALCVIEDAHWIDEVSESMRADLTVISQTPASRTLASRSPGDRRRSRRVAQCRCSLLHRYRPSLRSRAGRRLRGRRAELTLVHSPSCTTALSAKNSDRYVEAAAAIVVALPLLVYVYFLPGLATST